MMNKTKESSYKFYMEFFLFYFSKKKIKIFILSLFSLILLIFIIRIYNQKSSVETCNLLTKNKVIILDAGHGIPDEGAQSKNRISEAPINLAIVKKIQKLLEDNGNTVILTRTDEKGIYNENSSTIREKKVSDIKNRVAIGNDSSADIFISIHLNKILQEQCWGWQTFFKEGNEESKRLATCLQEGLNQSVKKENKRVPLKIENIYIMDNVRIPISIVECGFLSNAEEEKLLQTEEYQEKIANGIYIGIMDYFNN